MRIQTTLTQAFTKGLLNDLSGVNSGMSRGQKVNQMADLIEDGLEQVGLLFGKDDLRGAHSRLEQLEDLFIDAADLAETTAVASLAESRAKVRDAKRTSDDVQKLLNSGDKAQAKQLLRVHKEAIEEAASDLRRVAKYLKD